MIDFATKIQLVNKITQNLIQSKIEFSINIDGDNDYYIICRWQEHTLTFFIGVLRSWWFMIIECQNIGYGKLTVNDDPNHYQDYLKVVADFLEKVQRYEQNKSNKKNEIVA